MNQQKSKPPEVFPGTNLRYPGNTIAFTGVANSGHFANEYGNGEFDISFFTPAQLPMYVDAVTVRFSAPSDEQALSLATAPKYTKEERELCTASRSLSWKQAKLVRDVLTQCLKLGFPEGTIPANVDIDETTLGTIISNITGGN